MPWKSLSNHKKTECLERSVRCPHRRYGCTASLKAKELKEHLANNKIKHLSEKCDFLEKVAAEEKARYDALMAALKEKTEVGQNETNGKVAQLEFATNGSLSSVRDELGKLVSRTYAFIS